MANTIEMPIDFIIIDFFSPEGYVAETKLGCRDRFHPVNWSSFLQPHVKFLPAQPISGWFEDK